MKEGNEKILDGIFKESNVFLVAGGGYIPVDEELRKDAFCLKILRVAHEYAEWLNENNGQDLFYTFFYGFGYKGEDAIDVYLGATSVLSTAKKIASY